MGLTWKSPEELIELYEETTGRLTAEVAALKAKLAASQGREAAMRAALEMAFRHMHAWAALADGDDPATQDDLDEVRAALATDGSGWVSPETVSGLVEGLRGLLRDEWMTYEGNIEATGHASVDDLSKARDALAAFENSKRGGK